MLLLLLLLLQQILMVNKIVTEYFFLNLFCTDGDFIEVPPLDIKMFEPFLLLGVESQQNTTNNTSSELIDLEEEEEESSHHSSIIEDLQAILDSEKDQPAPSTETTTSQVNQLDLDQLQTELISDTAVQLNTARGNERLTATLTDTMHEETQVILHLLTYLILIYRILLVSTSFIRHSLSR